MNEERIKDLLDKYKAGETTSNEELYLQNNSNELHREHHDMFTYIGKSKIKAPENFNREQWKIFELKQKQKRINRYSMVSIAASIIVVVSLLLMNPSENKMSTAEKQALLDEALLMIEEPQKENLETVLYEDDMVIIYTSN